MPVNHDADPQNASSIPAGWYHDPSNPDVLRWWDGSQWTDMVTELKPDTHFEKPLPIQGQEEVQDAFPAQQPVGTGIAQSSNPVEAAGANASSAQVSMADSVTSTDQASPVKKRKRSLLIGGISAMAIIVVAAVVAIFVWMSPVQREEGAWPDLAYLCALVDRPDDLVKAVNDPDLTAAYQKYKADPEGEDSIIKAPIVIDEMESYIGERNEVETSQVQFNLVMESPDKVYGFGLEYKNASRVEALAYDEWSSEFVSAAFALSTNNSRTGVAEKALEKKAKYQNYDDMVDKIAVNPAFLLGKTGLMLNGMDNVQQSYGAAPWEDGYTLAMHGYVPMWYEHYGTDEQDRGFGPVVAGYATKLSGDYEKDGSVCTIYVDTQSADAFSFSSLSAERSNLMIDQVASFTIICSRDSVLSASVEDEVTELSEANRRIWEFGDGSLPVGVMETL